MFVKCMLWHLQCSPPLHPQVTQIHTGQTILKWNTTYKKLTQFFQGRYPKLLIMVVRDWGTGVLNRAASDGIKWGGWGWQTWQNRLETSVRQWWLVVVGLQNAANFKEKSLSVLRACQNLLQIQWYIHILIHPKGKNHTQKLRYWTAS